ncbi:MAG: mandelate racemase [Burkholderiales bacterium]
MTAPAFTIVAIELFERPVRLRLPFRFGVVTLTACPQAFARATIRLEGGMEATGVAAEMIVPKWFDKDLALSNEDNFTQLRAVLGMAREAYLADPAPDTAFGHFARHYDAHLSAAAARDFNPLLANYGPALIDRALLDALCRGLGLDFYTALKTNLPGIGARRREFAGLDMDRYLAGRTPAQAIEARHTVGLVDPITAADVKVRVGDGLPETLEEVVAHYGHRYFTLKVGGDPDAAIARLEAIAAVLDAGSAPYYATLDGNEQYADAAAVAKLLARMRAAPRLARLTASILFVEQPINRKTALEADFKAAPLGLPVIVDESDGNLDTFVIARERGYTGVSSKTCKGLYKSILNAARCAHWNAAEGGARYFMSAEDLTTQAGLAVQQDIALINLIGIGHVERNGHHYVDGMAACPAGEQAAFLAAHPDLYERSHGAVRLSIRNGRLAIGSLACRGFASAALPDFAAMAPLVVPPHP